jgi:hypothetical protein
VGVGVGWGGFGGFNLDDTHISYPASNAPRIRASSYSKKQNCHLLSGPKAAVSGLCEK